ncbi:class II histone deacetylase [Bacillus sp. UNC438CL73TsuS30]|uniref:class II histone deacetylase n=1 Tax=Bacillus sp. UNC438CL73TsuS30 TaxID=1340434 RepID=UPI00047C6B84|nr:class II histone deacetylase [Bacillus sp. UNC438CL73TsuS30]
MEKKTAYIYDESSFWHDTGNGALFIPSGGFVEPDSYVESPASKRRVNNLLERCGMMKQLEVITPRPATRKEIEYYHTEEYINRIKALSDGFGGDAGDGYTPFGKGSYEIALLSAGAAITGVEAVMEERVKNAYVMSRPAGHHAEADCGRGFCIFNNVVVAAEYAKQIYGLNRIMILDWDVHHGNGTENAFYNDPSTLFISLHQEYNFPQDRGFAEHIGEGEGLGFNINIPLPPGTSNEGYIHAFERVIIPVANEFKPELIIVSAGQDSSIYDPLSRMMVNSEGFRQMTDLVKGIADRHCNGRIVICHEGGYSTAYVPFCTLAIIESLSGLNSGVEDPFRIFHTNMLPIHRLMDHQKAYVDNVVELISPYWNLD